MMRSVILHLLGSLLIAGSTLGQTPSPAETLVRKLGDPVPAEREQAAGELRRLGKAAVPELEAGLKYDDAEIRRACAELLEAIRSDRGPRVEAFLNGEEPKDLPFPGWDTFKKAVGNDRLARLTYFDLSQSNPKWIEQLAKNPKQVSSQAAELCTSIWNRQGPKAVGAKRSEQILIAMIAVALDADRKAETFNPFQTMLYQPDVRQLVQADPIYRRLANRILTARSEDDLNTLLQTAYLANNLGLTDYMEGTLKPAILKMVDSLEENPKDPNRLGQIVNLIQASRLTGSLRSKITPLVRKLTEAAVKSIEDGTAMNNPSLVYQASNACQSLGLQDIADEVLKPAVRKMILQSSEKLDDINRYYQVINLARVLRLEDDLQQVLQPAVCRLIAEVVKNPNDENRFNTAFNLARNLNLNEAIEGVLRPAARERIIRSLEQPPDFNRLTQAIYQARNLQINDIIEDTLKPVFLRQSAVLLENPDMNRIQQCYYLCQNLGDMNLIEKAVKPAFLKQIKALESKPGADNSVQQALSLAKQMGSGAEAVPLARKAAQAKNLPGYSRGQAILTIAEFGTEKDLLALESLLGDTTQVGRMGVNRLTLTAEIRDVVLGAILFKKAKPLADFGFPYFKVIPQLRPVDAGPSSLGFATSEERTAAFKKWEEFKASEKANPREQP